MGYSTSFGMLVWGTCSCFQIFQRNSKKPSCRLDPPKRSRSECVTSRADVRLRLLRRVLQRDRQLSEALVPKRHLRAFSDLTASRELF